MQKFFILKLILMQTFIWVFINVFLNKLVSDLSSIRLGLDLVSMGIRSIPFQESFLGKK